MTTATRLTSEQRTTVVERIRNQPDFFDRLYAATAQMVDGRTYTVETFKNGRRRSVSGRLAAKYGDDLELRDEAGRKHRVFIPDISRITAPIKENG